ncbi:MAG: ABC transporter substrate-binding protein [Patescibacteria group bacterium]
MFKKFRSSIWILHGITSRHRLIILVSFIITILLSVVFIRFQPGLKTGTTDLVVLGVVGNYTPSELPLKTQQLISSGLTQTTDAGEVKPALATSWKTSEDGKSYTFELRQDILWHDGSHFTASDVNYNVKEVEFVPTSKYTLTVKLKEPFAPLPSFLSKPLFKKGLIGVGSYKVVSTKLKGEKISLLKLQPVDKGLPRLDVKFFPSERTAKTAYKLGEVEVLDEISDPDPFTLWKGVEVDEHVMYSRYVGIFFNTEYEALQTKEVRQALAYAVEKPLNHRIVSPISSKSWAYTTRVKLYEQDFAQARKLVEESLQDKELTLFVFPQYLSLAHNVVAAWKELGVSVKIKVVDTVPGDFQILLASQELLPDPDQYILWHSTQADTNITHYANPKIDKLLEDARKENDQEKRVKLYYDFQRYLVEDAPAVFLFHPTTYNVRRI